PLCLLGVLGAWVAFSKPDLAAQEGPLIGNGPAGPPKALALVAAGDPEPLLHGQGPADAQLVTPVHDGNGAPGADDPPGQGPRDQQGTGNRVIPVDPFHGPSSEQAHVYPAEQRPAGLPERPQQVQPDVRPDAVEGLAGVGRSA